MLAYPLCVLPLATAYYYTERDCIFQVASMPRIYDGACLSLLMYIGTSQTTASYVAGDVEVGWG